MNKEYPTLEQFCKAAEKVQIIALSTKISWDHESVMSLAGRFIDEEYFFLLESAAAGSGPIPRYSFLGFSPLWSWELKGGVESISRQLKGESKKKLPLGANPIEEMHHAFSELKLKHLEGQAYQGPDLAALGGVVGFCGYELAAMLEPKIGAPLEKRLDLPDMLYYLPENYLIFDQLTRSLYVFRFVSVEGQGAQELKLTYDSACKKLDQLQESLLEPTQLERVKFEHSSIDFSSFSSTVAEGPFLEKVKICLAEISKGEIFQIQIGNRLSKQVEAHPFSIFRHLRMLNPSPYMFYYKFQSHIILGSSPEMMVNLEGSILTHRPIAGTRKRTWKKDTDQLMKKELLQSEKERAEHIMLVDLGRNDLGRISRPGSVHVQDLMTVEEYSHVFHMVSEITGELELTFNAATALSASFPNGTVTGAPKVRAMELINQLEPCAREFYAGSLGLFSFNGDLKSTILIRSIHICDGLASTQASAGIVYDSIPAHEWMETRHKMSACLYAMQNTK